MNVIRAIGALHDQEPAWFDIHCNMIGGPVEIAASRRVAVRGGVFHEQAREQPAVAA
jgi:hypothetical protein